MQDFSHLVIGETDFHGPGSGILEFHLLFHIGIKRADDIRSQQLIQRMGGMRKESVVEQDNLPAGAVVMVQRFYLRLLEFLLQAAAQQAPVAPSPAVNALLDIAHHQGVVAGGHAVLQQRAEVVPLDIGRILEFVQEEVVEAHAQFLIDERSVGPVDNAF